MRRNRLLEGSLIQKEDASDDCWTTVSEFIKKILLPKVGVKFPVKDGEDFVIYGFQTPGEDQKDKLWVSTDRADHFTGYFKFIEGMWRRIYDHSIQDVVWKHGDSRDIEEGFQLIDGTVQSIPVDVQEHIIGFYKIDAVNSTPLFPVYQYFATIYIGI